MIQRAKYSFPSNSFWLTYSHSKQREDTAFSCSINFNSLDWRRNFADWYWSTWILRSFSTNITSIRTDIGI